MPSMSSRSQSVTGVPTNIITGFLGVGKTSTILHLLNHKPAGERWAILVNEFGEIGIDGGLFKGRHSEEHGVFIREVPSGCMCCTAGLPMQVALSQLLRTAKPDRLLIEPTGLGHPEEVVQTLTGQNFQKVLTLQKILTLVDARKISDSRYTEHETFQQQIAIADTIIGNKQDLYQEGDKTALETYVEKHCSSEVDVVFTHQGAITPTLLEGLTNATSEGHRHSASEGDLDLPYDDTPIPECGFLKAINKGEGFHSVGWRFSPTQIFDRNKLYIFLSGVVAERLKAVFITESGPFGYNMTSDALTEVPLDDCDESRIEIISTQIGDEWEAELFNCVVT